MNTSSIGQLSPHAERALNQCSTSIDIERLLHNIFDRMIAFVIR
jgi:hypothetical protein